MVMPIIIHNHVNNYKTKNHPEDTKVSVPFTKLNTKRLWDIFISVIFFCFSAEKYVSWDLVAINISIILTFGGSQHFNRYMCILFWRKCIWQNVSVLCSYFNQFDDEIPFLLIYLQNSTPALKAYVRILIFRSSEAWEQGRTTLPGDCMKSAHDTS